MITNILLIISYYYSCILSLPLFLYLSNVSMRCKTSNTANLYLTITSTLQICKTLHRQPKHLLDFLLAELGTSGSVDGNSQLIIKGRFQQKQIENVLRRYIKEYVTCHTCRSPDTILQKDTRLFFLQCETCGSRCSVASIKSGFQVSYYLRLSSQNSDIIISRYIFALLRL